jgi:serine/threonine protein kinase
MEELVAGRFELADRIGSGGVGSVWRAYDRQEKRYCAAKLVRRQEPEAALRVLREQSLRLAHPHVLTPYAWAAGDGVVVAASDLVRGGSLATLIRDHGALPWRYAVEILGQLLDALAHVHSAGLVHRDLKPANVLLEMTGQGAPHARLADFGIAYLRDGPRLTESGFVVGSPGYLAPEVLAGRPPHPGQDLFAAGVVARQLLTGAERPDPSGQWPPAPDSSISWATDNFASSVPEPVWTVVNALLAPDPAARPRDAATARRLLEPAMAEPLRLPAMSADGEPIEVFDVLGPDPERVEPPRSRVWWWVAAAGALVLAALGIVLAIVGVVGFVFTSEPAMPASTVPQRPNAGERCEWQDVAAPGTAADGTPVRCVRRPDGSYTWEPA